MYSCVAKGVGASLSAGTSGPSLEVYGFVGLGVHDYGGTTGGRDVSVLSVLPMEYADLVRGFGFFWIVVIRNTVGGLAVRPLLGVTDAYVDVCFHKNVITFPARQPNPSLCTSCFGDLEAAGGRREHNFLPHVPCETLGA